MITESAAYWQEQLDEERARAEDLVDERDQARAERDEALAARDDALVALAEMTRERDALRARLDAAFDALTTVATVKPSTLATP